MLTRCFVSAILLISASLSIFADSISGVIIDDRSGNALASVDIKLWRNISREIVAEAETEQDGRFRFDSLAPGEYRLDVSRSNWVSLSTRVRVPVQNLQLRMLRYGLIAGQVTDTQGNPVPEKIFAPDGGFAGGTRVVLMRSQGGALQPVDREPAELDIDARFRFASIPPGDYAIAVSYSALPGIGSGMLFYPDNSRPRIFTVLGGEAYVDLHITLLPTTTYDIHGTVQAARSTDRFAISLVLASSPEFSIAMTQTGETGSFHFESIPAGVYDVLVVGPRGIYVGWPSGFTSSTAGGFGRQRINLNDSLDGLTIITEPGRSIAMTSQSPQGMGACPETPTMRLTPLEAWPIQLTRTFKIELGKGTPVQKLAPGRYALSIPEPDSACRLETPRTIDLRDGADSGIIAVSLEGPGSVRGHLAKAADNSATYVVALMPRTGPIEPLRMAMPDGEGQFSFSTVRPGAYRVIARVASQPVAARPHSDLEQALFADVEVQPGKTTEVEVSAQKAAKE